MTPALVGLRLGGVADAWTSAGFTVVDDHIAIGRVDVHLTGGETAWAFSEVDDGVLDGIPTFAGTAAAPAAHANTTASIDHVVVASPDLDRTTEAFGAVGLDLRRTRDAGRMEQRFFRAGEVILEVLGTPGAHRPGPSTIWGLALTVDDIDATAALLGEHLGAVKDAVQPGRRIASLRHEALGVPAPVAFLTPPPPRHPA
jgi:hypothetical protein